MTAHHKPDAPVNGGSSETKVIKVGNSLGMILPKELLARLKVGQGDKLFIVESSDGFLLSPYDPAIADQVNRGQAFMRKYRDTFRALAK